MFFCVVFVYRNPWCGVPFVPLNSSYNPLLPTCNTFFDIFQKPAHVYPQICGQVKCISDTKNHGRDNRRGFCYTTYCGLKYIFEDEPAAKQCEIEECGDDKCFGACLLCGFFRRFCGGLHTFIVSLLWLFVNYDLVVRIANMLFSAPSASVIPSTATTPVGNSPFWYSSWLLWSSGVIRTP